MNAIQRAITDLKSSLSSASTMAQDIDDSGDLLDGDALDDIEADLHIASTRLKELQQAFDRRVKVQERISMGKKKGKS